ncbi:pentapeptide MXKDX repeat protein [Paraburkholderia sp. BR14263]|uniref:pentapeptide MXKDX repeat protein n=1 Tax=unclassified Paraburkholderia TaxID=2615204 RepID=UPI0034CE71EA
MNKLTATILASCFSFATAGAFADDSVPTDATANDAPSLEITAKSATESDAMSADSAAKDAMKEDAMNHDGMAGDETKNAEVKE